MGSASYTKGTKRVGGGNHEWVGMNHEIHERREREIQNKGRGDSMNHERHERHELIV